MSSKWVRHVIEDATHTAHLIIVIIIIIRKIIIILEIIMIIIMVIIIITCCSSVPGPPTQAVPSIGVESVPQVNSASLNKSKFETFCEEVNLASLYIIEIFPNKFGNEHFDNHFKEQTSMKNKRHQRCW